MKEILLFVHWSFCSLSCPRLQSCLQFCYHISKIILELLFSTACISKVWLLAHSIPTSRNILKHAGEEASLSRLCNYPNDVPFSLYNCTHQRNYILIATPWIHPVCVCTDIILNHTRSLLKYEFSIIT